MGGSIKTGGRRVAWISVVMYAAILLALFSLLWTPTSPVLQQFKGEALVGPSAGHPFGIDGLGRDFFSRLWRGAGNTVALALAAMALNFIVATLLLVIERNSRKTLRPLVPILIGVWVAVPVLLFGLLLRVLLSPSIETLVYAAALGAIPLSYRQLRVVWLEQRNSLYAQASEVLGANRWRLLSKSLWPNLRGDVVAVAKLVFAISALELAGLAFIGLINDPSYPELGVIMRENKEYIDRAPRLVVLPGLALSILLGLVHLSRTAARS